MKEAGKYIWMIKRGELNCPDFGRKLEKGSTKKEKKIPKAQ